MQFNWNGIQNLAYGCTSVGLKQPAAVRGGGKYVKYVEYDKNVKI